jgi:O-antigen/teichoic acid export membrane protein
MSKERRARRVSRWITTGSWVLSDQAVVSAGSFVATILLARSLGPDEFGVYAWALIGILLVSEVPASVVLSPHSVVGARLEHPEYVVHTSTMAALQLLIAIASAAVILLAALPAEAIAPGAGEVFMAAALAVLGWQLREFVRRVLQTANRWRGSLLIAGIGAMVQIIALAVLLETGTLTASSALWVLAAASAACAVVGALMTRTAFGRRVSYRSAREAWVLGRWLLGSQAAAQLGKYVEGVALPVFAGPAAYGLYRAVTQLIGVFELPIKALGNFLRPSFSRLAVGGPAAVDAVVRPLLWSGSLVLFVAAAGAGVFGREILHVVYGDEYIVVGHLVFVVALYPLLTFGRTVLGSAVIAVDRSPRSLLYSAVAGSAGAIIVGPISIILWGVNGAPAAVITGGAITAGWLWAAWVQKTRSGRLAAEASSRERIGLPNEFGDTPTSHP